MERLDGKRETEESVLCAANSYIEKFYLNEDYKNLPEDVQQQLQIICVQYTEEIGGIFLMKFDKEGNLKLESVSEENDYLYDEIGSELKLRAVSKKYRELFEKLELYYEGLQSIRAAERGSGKVL